MTKMCPKCAADTDTLEESQQFCIHEELMMAAGGLVLVAAAAMYRDVV